MLRFEGFAATSPDFLASDCRFATFSLSFSFFPSPGVSSRSPPAPSFFFFFFRFFSLCVVSFPVGADAVLVIASSRRLPFFLVSPRFLGFFSSTGPSSFSLFFFFLSFFLVFFFSSCSSSPSSSFASPPVFPPFTSWLTISKGSNRSSNCSSSILAGIAIVFSFPLLPLSTLAVILLHCEIWGGERVSLYRMGKRENTSGVC